MSSSAAYCPDCKQDGWACTCRADHPSNVKRQPMTTDTPLPTDAKERVKIAFTASLMNANAGMKWLDHDSMDEMIEAAWIGFEQPLDDVLRPTPSDSEVEIARRDIEGAMICLAKRKEAAGDRATWRETAIEAADAAIVALNAKQG